jgi:L-ribulokinase
MDGKYVIGLDYGTESGRAVLVSCSDGTILATAEKKYSHGVIDTYLPGGSEKLPNHYALQYPGDYLDVLLDIVSTVMNQSGVMQEQVIGLSIDFTSSTVLPIDGEGVPLCMKTFFKDRSHAYAKLWKHHGALKECDQINQLLEEQNLLNDFRFGGRISPELLVPKVLEILHKDPEVYDEAVEFLEAGDWMTRELTKADGRSISMAGYKAWWQSEGGYPDESFFAQLDSRMRGFSKQKLKGTICPVGERIGTLSKVWAEKLNLKEGIAVGASVIDSHAGVPGCGICESGQMMLVIGTSSVAIALSDTPYAGKGICGNTKGGIVPGYYALESGLAAVGDMFAWFIQNFVPAAYMDSAAEQGQSIHEYLSDKAALYTPGESGLLVLDWWNGNKTPFVDGKLSGVILGLTLQTTPEELYRALIEATAYGTRMLIETFEEAGVEISEIVASGGIVVKNPFLMQIYADVTGKRIKIAKSSQTAAVGSAIYAAIAAGAENGGYDTYEEAVKNMTEVSEKQYWPEFTAQEKYNLLYKEYQSAGVLLGRNSAILKRLKSF